MNVVGNNQIEIVGKYVSTTNKLVNISRVFNSLIFSVLDFSANFSTSLIFTPIFFNPCRPTYLYRVPAPPHGLKTTKPHL